jgi:hypothetical protein
VVQAVYLDVPVESAARVTPFNPFVSADLIGMVDANPTFTIRISMAGLMTDAMRLECSRFVLVTAADEWRRATDCTFAQGGWEDYLADEEAQVTVRFAGYGITDAAQIKGLTYRRGENDNLVRYTLWQLD